MKASVVFTFCLLKLSLLTAQDKETTVIEEKDFTVKAQPIIDDAGEIQWQLTLSTFNHGQKLSMQDEPTSLYQRNRASLIISYGTKRYVRNYFYLFKAPPHEFYGFVDQLKKYLTENRVGDNAIVNERSVSVVEYGSSKNLNVGYPETINFHMFTKIDLIKIQASFEAWAAKNSIDYSK